jgi:AraC-like DNA-binding protein
MTENGTATFANPDDYQAGIDGASVNFIVTGGGDFKARLTWLNLHHLHVLRGCENLPRIAFISFNCLTADDANGNLKTRRHHSDIMVQFEDALTTHSGPQLSMPALCAAIGVPERTLRVCCTEFLGMSPTRYLLLRRLNMVRSALRRADPANASVTEIARTYQFQEPGRFAVTYRTVFGEMPGLREMRIASSLNSSARN